MAEGILQYKAQKRGMKWMVDSAGTNGIHIGETPHPLSRKVASLNGIDISVQRSRRFVAEDLARFDKVYAMSADVIDEMKWIAGNQFLTGKVDLLMNEIYPGMNMDVPDPWYGAEPGYHKVFRMLDQACDRIIEKYSAQGGLHLADDGHSNFTM